MHEFQCSTVLYFMRAHYCFLVSNVVSGTKQAFTKDLLNTMINHLWWIIEAPIMHNENEA